MTDSPADRHQQVLQWGHDDGVVECSNTAVMDLAGHRATAFSMGPRRWVVARVEWEPLSSPTPTGCPSFNGATTMVSWNGPRGMRVAPARFGFNGATTMVSWTGRIGLSSCFPPCLLQWGHDDGVVEWQAYDAAFGIRGALQWGHDDGVVEWSNAKSGSDGLLRASMGPRRWCRGMGD